MTGARERRVLLEIVRLPSPERENAAELYLLLNRTRKVINRSALLLAALSLPFLAAMILFLPTAPFPAILAIAAIGFIVEQVLLVTLVKPRIVTAAETLSDFLNGDPTLKTFTLGRLMRLDPVIRVFVIKLGLRESPGAEI